MKYNYVIFWNEWDLYDQSFEDIKHKSYARYVTSPKMYMRDTRLHAYSFLCRHPRVKRYLGNVFGDCKIQEKFFYSSYWNDDFIDSSKKVFVFDVTWLKGERAKYIYYLKQKHSDSYYVLLCFDLWDTLELDFKWAKSTFDIVLSFDQNDFKKYGFLYHPLVFSEYKGDLEDMPYSDVYFLGQPKNRLQEIIACVEKLWLNNVSTDIHLVNVPAEDRVYIDKIHYSGGVEYKNNIQHFMHSNCALELMQHGGVGYTQRMCEAIAFDRKIITNNALIHEAPFFNQDYIFQIKSSDDITPELCERVKKVEPVDYHYKEQISPIELLEFIENHLG